MSSETAPDDPTPQQLRAMDDDEARRTLPVAQYERREKLLELDAQAAETEQRIAEQNERVADLTVHADTEQLGTRVEVYGNDLLVHVDGEDREFRQAAERVEGFQERIDDEDDDLSDADREDLADALAAMLDGALIEWNGHSWRTLPEDDRADVLATCRDKWGIEGLLLAWADIAAAIAEDRQERVDVIDSFRGA